MEKLSKPNLTATQAGSDKRKNINKPLNIKQEPIVFSFLYNLASLLIKDQEAFHKKIYPLTPTVCMKVHPTMNLNEDFLCHLKASLHKDMLSFPHLKKYCWHYWINTFTINIAVFTFLLRIFVISAGVSTLSQTPAVIF